VEAVGAAEVENAIAVIVRAFATDPMARWCYPDPAQYAKHFPGVVRAFGRGAFAGGTADRAGDGLGAALWLAPGVTADEEAMGALMQATVAPGLLAEIAPVVERMHSYHPEGPHWFLPLIGVDPACQHRGYGSRLLEEGLKRVDQDHLPAYLDSTNPLNVPLYRRHGFVELGTIQIGASPPIVPMLRAAR
jgi:ribosomal protein S18 acetylase RimI-like enzyme